METYCYCPTAETLLPMRDDEPSSDGRQETSRLSCGGTLQARDTSTTCRDEEHEDTRHSLSQTSILSVTFEVEDDEEEEEEDPQPPDFLFADDSSLHRSFAPPALTEAPKTPDSYSSSFCAPTLATEPSPVDQQQVAASSWLMEQVADTFVEKLCPSSSGDDSCGTTLQQVCFNTVQEGPQVHRQVELDILALLGCPTDPVDDELDAWVTPLFDWKPTDSPKRTKTQPVGPYRRTSKQRADRIRTWRTQACDVVVPLQKSRSMDDTYLQRFSYPTKPSLLPKPLLLDDDPLGIFIGKGMDPIRPADLPEDLGYDSDPEIAPRTVTPTFPQKEEPPQQEEEYVAYDGHRTRLAEEMKYHMSVDANSKWEIHHSVQESLSYTWSLTWHPEASSGEKPAAIEAWVERGSLVNYGYVVVEPKIMWRQVYQPQLASSRKLNESCATPYKVRVLNACRIVEATEAEPLDRDKYPMARTACSFFLRTCMGEEYLFEAASVEERDAVVHRWKLVVARLAALAVMEDMDRMALEFFTPVVTPDMLTRHNSYDERAHSV